MLYDVTILTKEGYVNPAEPDDYVSNVLLEDHLLKEALETKGLKVYRTNWDDPEMDWLETRFAVVRTTWDYFERAPEFLQWLNTVSQQTQLINPFETLLWNIDKHYLLDLRAKDIAIVPTIALETLDSRSLREVVAESGWEKVILKPAISGAARHTYKISRENIGQYEQLYTQLIQQEAMLLQPYIESITERGEVSHMLFGGRYSHSVLKKAKTGDFRVQDDFGGTVYDYTASEAEIDFARRVVANVDPMPVYARVDVVWDSAGQPALAELELIEPELWLRQKPASAGVFANALFNYMAALAD